MSLLPGPSDPPYSHFVVGKAAVMGSIPSPVQEKEFAAMWEKECAPYRHQPGMCQMTKDMYEQAKKSQPK